VISQILKYPPSNSRYKLEFGEKNGNYDIYIFKVAGELAKVGWPVAVDRGWWRQLLEDLGQLDGVES
jgi:hypothetical protein